MRDPVTVLFTILAMCTVAVLAGLLQAAYASYPGTNG
jgi:hypothetical protein